MNHSLNLNQTMSYTYNTYNFSTNSATLKFMQIYAIAYKVDLYALAHKHDNSTISSGVVWACLYYIEEELYLDLSKYTTSL